MKIYRLIRKSKPYQKLLGKYHTPYIKETGQFFTLSGTTQDIQLIILELLSKKNNIGIIYATAWATPIEKYLSSLNIVENPCFSKLKDLLLSCNVKRVDKVTQHGEYTISGDTITVWPSLYDHPIRFEFFGDTCERINIYDELYHSEIDKLHQVALGDESYLKSESDRQVMHLFSPKKNISKRYIIFTSKQLQAGHIHFHFSYPSLFFTRLDLFKNEIRKRLLSGWHIQIATKHPDEIHKQIRHLCTTEKYTSGFENPHLKIAVYTDREIFGTLYISKEKAKQKKEVNRYLAQLEGEISFNDHIVHEDYGIAVYKGIEQKKVMGKKMDYLILEYDAGDELSVPIHQIHKLTKYIGPAHTPPKITRLGKTSWKRIKKKVKESVVLIAKELIQHYAKIEVAEGISLHKHEWEEKCASEFEFDETEDQKRAISEILADLSSKRPSNRLLVGDVGFGKTEVAIRAAFRSVMNGKQVAVLCPTTILVSQHYSVFKHRMRNYPIQIATLSRFGSRSKNAEIVEKVKRGDVDIIIGTHRLLSDDMEFKSLGLIVIDEEQRFGVKQKEKIKKLAYGCNTLYMSATPIPRTLSMALSNLKDISIITTPPPGRKAIKTFVLHRSTQKMLDAIRFEVQRGGQVYFLHNEVRTIESIRQKLEGILPDVRFKVAHGQMHPQTLDKIMREFYSHSFDCLICTTIIENGIDIPNVNTIIINKAERFGLAQLYQLRGRVGRSKRQAYCYVLYSKRAIMNSDKNQYTLRGKRKVIPFAKAKARLEALIESQELGSGFKIASRDLEIRGAGNLLGKEQHGNISQIGLGLYTQLLSDEIEKMKKHP